MKFSKKLAITMIPIGLMLMVVLYLTGSLIAWDLNPDSWSPLGRFIIGMLEFGVFIVAILLPFGKIDSEEE